MKMSWMKHGKLFASAAAVVFLGLSTAAARAGEVPFTASFAVNFGSPPAAGSLETVWGPEISSVEFVVESVDPALNGGAQLTGTATIEEIDLAWEGRFSPADELGIMHFDGTFASVDGSALSGRVSGDLDLVTGWATLTFEGVFVTPDEPSDDTDGS